MTYFMETDSENERLEVKTNFELLRRQLDEVGYQSGMDFADLGCGTAVAAREVSKLSSSAIIHAVDVSEKRVEYAQQLTCATDSIKFTVADVQKLALPDQCVDFSWARFLFEYLPRPEIALAHMVRITRPGGTVAVLDLDGQLTTFYPLPPEAQGLVEQALALLANTGFDAFVGRKLPSLFRKAGLSDIRVNVAPYQVYHGDLNDSDRRNWELKFEGAARMLQKVGADSQISEHLKQVLQGLDEGSIFYYSTLIQVTGQVPEE